MRASVVITGLGAVSALGPNAAALRDAVLSGRDGIVPMKRIDLSPLHPIGLAGEVTVEPADAAAWAIRAAREAVADAGGNLSGRRVAVVSGTTDGERGDIGSIAREVHAALGIDGPAITISTACASSTNAIGLGRDLLERGDADVVIAGGAERLVPEMFAGFAALGVLSAEKCAPFGETVGTTLGEGAGYVVLEREGERGDARLRARLLGYALSSDAFHETSPEPRGEGIARAIAGCLEDAGLAAEAVEYVNAHGTGTAANDDAEWRGIKKALGARAELVPVSGSKGLLGHAQGACGVLEVIVTVLCLEAGRLPPSVRVGRGRRGGPTVLAPGPAPSLSTARIALSSNAAFGGANAVVALGLGMRGGPTDSLRRAVRIVGWAHHETGPGSPRDDGAWCSEEHDLRQSDPAARMLLSVTEEALRRAGLRVRGALRERTGIFAGATRVSPSSGAELRSSIASGGPTRASAPAFARAVLHAPAGAVSRFLSLRGPATTLVAEGVAGALAVAEAAYALETRRDADVLCAVGWDERATPDEAEGAGCLVLSTLSEDRGAPRISAVATAGRVEDAIALARARGDAPLVGAMPEAIHLSSGPRSAYGSLRDLSEVVERVRRDQRAALFVTSNPTTSVALLMVPGEHT